MSKNFKLVFFALVLLLTSSVSVLAYLLLTFDSNEYKQKVIQFVQDKHNRTLKLDGNIQFTVLPKVGVHVENISLSEYKQEQEFVAIEKMNVSLAVWPLLSKHLVVNEIVLTGVRLKVVKQKDGSLNLDDLVDLEKGKDKGVLATAEEQQVKSDAPLSWDIEALSMSNAEITYNDDAIGASYKAKNISLKTGRLANGLSGEINFDANITANNPQADIHASLKTKLTYDHDKKYIKFEKIDAKIQGVALDIDNMLLSLSGDIKANLLTEEFAVRDLFMSVSGKRAQYSLNASLKLPLLDFEKNKVAAEGLVFKSDMLSEQQIINAELTLKDIVGDEKSFKSEGVFLDLALKQPEQSYKFKLSTPLAGSVETKQLNLSNILVSLNATGEQFPNQSIESTLQGSVQMDGRRKNVQLKLNGDLLQSRIKARAAIRNFSFPVILYDVDVDRFDADIFMPKKATAPTKEGVAKVTEVEQPFDLSFVTHLNLDGNLKISALKFANIKASQVQLGIKAKNGLVNIAPLSAELYQGSVSGSVTVDATQAVPTFLFKESLRDVKLGALLKDAANVDIVEGRANINFNLETTGNTMTALKQGLNGNVALNMEGGTIKGFDFSKLIRGVRNVDQRKEVFKPAAGDKTIFSELKSNFKVQQGIANNHDLLIKSNSLRVTGSGDIDIANSSVDYLGYVTLPDAVEVKNGSVTIPVKLSGRLAEPAIKIDYSAMVRDVASQKFQARKEQLKEDLKIKLQEKLRGNVKDLFK